MADTWSFVVQKLDPQEDAATAPIRTPIGRLEPVDGATITWELNRPGELTLPVNLQSVPSEIDDALNAWMARSAEGRKLEILVYYTGSATPLVPVWAGPITSFTYTSFDRVTFRAKGDLAYLDELIIWEEYDRAVSGIDQFTLAYAIVRDSQRGTTGLNKYTNKGIVVDSNTRGLLVFPGGDGDSEISPLQAETTLEVLERISDLSDEYRFDYEIARAADGSLNFRCAEEIGEDVVGRVELGRDPVLEDITLTVTFTPNHHCTVVYAVGDGPEGTDSSEDNRVWYLAGRHDPGDLSNPATSLTQLGVVVLPVAAIGIREGNRDGSDVTAANLRGSIQEVAETYLNSRVAPWILPSGFKTKLDTGDGDGVGAFDFNVGDMIALSTGTGFGRAETTSARVQKKTVVTGPMPTIAVEEFV